MSTYSQGHKDYYLKNRERILERQRELGKLWVKTPRGIYSTQKRKAAQRNIEWLLSFDEWWDIWQASGHWEQRGNRKGYYCMSRHGDTGPYSVENVYINLFELNTKEVYLRNGVDEQGRFNERMDCL